MLDILVLLILFPISFQFFIVSIAITITLKNIVLLDVWKMTVYAAHVCGLLYCTQLMQSINCFTFARILWSIFYALFPHCFIIACNACSCHVFGVLQRLSSASFIHVSFVFLKNYNTLWDLFVFCSTNNVINCL